MRASKEFLEGLQRTAVSEGPDVDSDLLVVEPYFQDLEDDMDEREGEEGEDAGEAGMDGSGPYDVIIAPDAIQKTNQSGGGRTPSVFRT